MTKRILLHSVFAAMCLFWLLLPHYLAPVPCGIVLAMLCVFYGIYAWKTREWWGKPAVPEEKRKMLTGVWTAVLVLGALIVIGFAFLALYRWNRLGLPMVLLAGCLLFAAVEVLIRLGSGQEEQGIILKIGCYAALAGAGIAGALTFWRLSMGLAPAAYVALLTGYLAACMSFYFLSQGQFSGQIRSGICAGCIILAFALTITLNWRLGSGTGQTHSYQVTGKPYRNSVTCTLDDGSQFSYLQCPMAEGKVGKVYRYRGWFQITYLLRPNDPLNR